VKTIVHLCANMFYANVNGSVERPSIRRRNNRLGLLLVSKGGTNLDIFGILGI
jgi:hypothetical protein